MVMVRFDFEDWRGIKGIFIDGYMPDFSYLRQIDWERAVDKNLSQNPMYKRNFKKYIYNRYLKYHHQREATLRTQTRIYKGLIRSLRHKFCSINKACAEFIYPARGHRRIERIISYSKKKLRDYLPFFSAEIEKDQAEGKTNYFFDITFLDEKSANRCLEFDRCTNNWMEFLNFKIKEKSDYRNFKDFEKACIALLDYYVDYVTKEGLLLKE